MLSVEFVDRPVQGRVFSRERRVRMGDVAPSGRIRLDAIARYLQDIARDDSADSQLDNPMNWVVRRTVIRVERWAEFQENLQLATWCSGIGSRWAERRTAIWGENGSRIDTATLWVHFDAVTGRPARLGPGFAERYAEAAGGRGADAKLTLPPNPPDSVATMAWPLRQTDFDVLGHVNNAAYWEAVEELLADTWRGELPLLAVVEHREGLDAGVQVQLAHTNPSDGELQWWMRGGDVTNAVGAIVAG